MPVDLVLLGNLLVDDVVYQDGRTRMGVGGGAMLYGALGASLWKVRVGIVSVAGSDYPASGLDALRSRGVDLDGVKDLGRPGLRTWLLYERSCRRVIHQLERPTHAEVSPRAADIPSAYEDAKVFHLAPMPMSRDRELVAHLADREALITLDPYDEIRLDDLSPWQGVLDRIDGLFASEDELRNLSHEVKPEAGHALALRRLCQGRLRFVAHKRGARGGVLFDRDGDRTFEWGGSGHAEPPDPTGAGDAFAGGFLAGMIAMGKVEAALEQGVVSASFAIEGRGANGLIAATPALAEQRRHEWFGARAGA